MIKELKEHNNALELSSEYQCILPEVMNEVYSQYVKEEIERSERYLERENAEEDDVLYRLLRESTEKKLNEAKRLMPDYPEQAARVFMQLGSCHRIWATQKRILKEKYDITWYTPSELNPYVKFD